jgi:putative PIN family toxin of toxin-antitoxin system
LESPNKRIRAVVDTNVWISALLSVTRLASLTRALLNTYLDQRFSAVISRPLLRELAAVVARPQLSKRVPTCTDTAALLALLECEPMVAIAGTS